jgi:hypothetical protein
LTFLVVRRMELITFSTAFVVDSDLVSVRDRVSFRTVTSAVIEEVKAWQSRPLEAVYRAGSGIDAVEVKDDRSQVFQGPAQGCLHPGLGGCHEATGDGAPGSPRRLHAAGRYIQRPFVAASADVRKDLLDHPLGQDIAALEASHARQRHLTPVLRPDPLHVQRDRSSTQRQSRLAMAPPARRPLRPFLAPWAGQMLDFLLDEVRERSQPGADDELRECRLRVGGQLQRRSKPRCFRHSLRSTGRSCSDLHGRLLSPRGVSSYSHSRPSEGSRPSSHFQHDPGHPPSC